MDFNLTEDQTAFQDAARRFAADKLAPHAAKWDEESIFPVDVMREAAALGFAGNAYAKGDYIGAGLETASGLAAIVPGAGTAISLGIDGINMTRGNIKTAKGMMSSSGTAPARSAGVPTSSGRSNGQIIVKELVVHSEITMDKDRFGKSVTKVMNVKLDPVRPN